MNPRWRRLLCAALVSAGPLFAQQGDRKDEVQQDLPPDLAVPPATVRSPAEELATFRVQPGHRVELVAAEPLVGDPVVARFDEFHRLWVVEMRGYMPDVDGRGEDQPVGRIVVLQDDDGDGRMDRSTPFLEQLVLPRGVLPLRGGALAIVPPNLYWCPDADGDLRADRMEPVGDGFDAGTTNPEHSGNGLLWGLDNRVHLANHPWSYRRNEAGVWERLPAAGHGQWGLAQDDVGRLFFNYNSDWLRGDLVPGAHAVARRGLGGLGGTNVQLTADQSVFPARVTPGVNRGYQPGMLVDGVLQRNSAVCGVAVYRGGVHPELQGDVFVCEPAGNLVRRFKVQGNDGALQAANPHGKAEFLASVDERFRPVDLTMGPEGALYVVDMYRGVIQHKNFVTTFLRKQVLARGLERPIGLGRIWRVVPEDVGALQRPEPLGAMTDAQLVAGLASTSGSRRDTAQRLLVERRAGAVAPTLRAMVRDASVRTTTRIHALWVLEGTGALLRDDVLWGLHSGEPWLQAHALRAAAPWLRRGDRPVVEIALLAAAEGARVVQRQLALSLAAVPQPRRADALARLAGCDLGDAWLRSALAAGADGAEESFVAALGRAWGTAEQPGRADLLRQLARGLTASRAAERQDRLFSLAAGAPAVWQQQALLRGAVDALPKGTARAGWMTFVSTPTGLAAVQRQGDKELGKLTTELLSAVALKTPEVEVDADASDPAVAALVSAGSRVYAAHCAACHQPDGRGMRGLAPPVRDSEWVTGDPGRLARIVLHGVRGPIEVAGESWDLEMPAQKFLADSDLAAALTYLRRSWGHRATAVRDVDVAREREATKDRKGPWTAAELGGP